MMSGWLCRTFSSIGIPLSQYKRSRLFSKIRLDWIHSRYKWWAVVHMVMNLGVP